MGRLIRSVFLSVDFPAAHLGLHLPQSLTHGNFEDLDRMNRMMAVMVTFSSLCTLMSSLSLGDSLASLAGFVVFIFCLPRCQALF